MLHYRWLFTLLAVIAALHLLQRAEPGAHRHGAAAAYTGPRPRSTGVIRASDR
jgi:hypothetical protein